MHFLFSHSTVVPVGLHNSLFLLISNELLSSQLPWYIGVENLPELQILHCSRVKISKNKTVGLGKHEGRGEKATIYCRGMMVYPVLKQAILTTQQWWVKGKYKSIQFKTIQDGYQLNSEPYTQKLFYRNPQLIHS